MVLTKGPTQDDCVFCGVREFDGDSIYANRQATSQCELDVLSRRWTEVALP